MTTRLRRSVAGLAALALAAEGLGIALINWILGVVVRRQRMSLAGSDPELMSLAAWIAGGLFALYLLGCAFVALRAALRDRPPRTAARILLVTCGVVHGLLGAFCVALVGWGAFAAVMAVLALLVCTLLAYDPAEADRARDGGRRRGRGPGQPPEGVEAAPAPR
ncbi:hypothetical protein GO001_32885 [Streptomyces sp. NRRL B-1677]|uniref:Uncharacterized protein n=1 Tax=Streptomyces klenkii TaxID=1420899 RepID=A0A3B0BTA5_9ACTN|nr:MULTISPECIES: hypothetical protein [Streptomyces]MBF6049926.1 hypothetical protein [Streptomyces sp. NRRL B-1677]RKN76080.1 hypothetical protein D7231_03365 [Streptomyces klenkii]